MTRRQAWFISVSLLIALCYSRLCLAKTFNFDVSETNISEGIHGQIDWPSGDLTAYRGPVVVLISSANPSNRDGWMIRSIDAKWSNTRPLRSLSTAMLMAGFAVVRFETPGVRSGAKCRRKVEQGQLDSGTVMRDCVDIATLHRLTVDRYVTSLEQMLMYVQHVLPAARSNLVLVGISEGYWHADEIIRRAKIRVSSVIAIGGAVEIPRLISHWQAVQRPLETIWRFDENGDGVIENYEIKRGYAEGIGNITNNISDWLSPSGEWSSTNIDMFREVLERSYQAILVSTDEKKYSVELNWVEMRNGVRVPDVTESFWNLHLHGENDPLANLEKRHIPALFLWGAADQQIRVSYQIALIKESKARGASIEYFVYPKLHHLLSVGKDDDWFDEGGAALILSAVKVFLSKTGGDSDADTTARSPKFVSEE